MPALSVIPNTPEAPPVGPLSDRVRAALEQVRPAVQADGGDVELAGIDEATKTVRVRFRGTCVGCPSLPLTLRTGIERMIRGQIPEIERVVAVP